MTTPQKYQDVLQQMLSDPAAIERMVLDHREKQRLQREARATFVASPTFSGMLALLGEAPDGAGFDSEELAYFPERVVERVWQGRYTVEDTARLLDVLGNPTEKEVPAATSRGRAPDPHAMFFHWDYTFHGVVVSVLSGQGTIIGVRNR